MVVDGIVGRPFSLPFSSASELRQVKNSRLENENLFETHFKKLKSIIVLSSIPFVIKPSQKN